MTRSSTSKGHDELRALIPPETLLFSFSRSGGPGGQNVNKVNTRVTLAYDIEASDVLSDEEKERLRRKLGKRVSRDGVIRIVAAGHRTQAANRREATERFYQVVSNALKVSKIRRSTRIPKTAVRQRLQEKRFRSEQKSWRKAIRAHSE